MSNKRKKVFVGLSGGVDSSVAAALLKNGACPELGRRVEVIGVHLKCFNIDGCSEKDAEDARRVSEQLQIPFYVFDLEKEYKERVVKYMVDGYRQGLTPNPDVMCNKEIKFGLFLERALKLGADYVATGHYVRLREQADDCFVGNIAQAVLAGCPELVEGLKQPSEKKIFSLEKNYSGSHRNRRPLALFIAKDKNKDQSYFLWTLTQKQLKHCLFPIGDYTKPQVRRLAKKFGLVTAKKKDSQGICFLGQVSLPDFLQQYIPTKRGVVLNTVGQKIGEHKGIYFYTIGQRSGLGIGGSAKPQYIAEKNVKTNTIVVAEGEDNPALYKKDIELKNINFVNPLILNSKFSIPVYVRVRYRQPLAKAKLCCPNPSASSEFRLIFDEPQKFIASGQSAVFYSRAGEMLGGGIIK